jgi:hypothetical protein
MVTYKRTSHHNKSRTKNFVRKRPEKGPNQTPDGHQSIHSFANKKRAPRNVRVFFTSPPPPFRSGRVRGSSAGPLIKITQHTGGGGEGVSGGLYTPGENSLNIGCGPGERGLISGNFLHWLQQFGYPILVYLKK